MSRNLTWLFSFALVLMLGGSIGLTFHLLGNTSIKTANKANTPDSFVIQAAYQQYDVNGHVQSKFSANKVVHYSQDNVSVFVAPQITAYGEDLRPWLISADQGKSVHGSQQIELTKNVKVQHLTLQQRPELTLLTSSLEYFPELQFAQTNKPVTIIQPGMIVNSLGLKANLKTAEVKLISEVKARYELDKTR